MGVFGVSSPQSHYTGDAGEKYFALQDRGGSRSATYNCFFFYEHISCDDTVLDFGCGGGHLLSLLNGRRKVGVDVNPAALTAAKTRGIEVYESIVEVEEASVTRIVTSHALEHVSNPYDTLIELRKRLIQGGMLIWLSPMDDWHNRHQRSWQPEDFDMHLYAWTPRTIGNLLSVAGYQVKEVRTVTHAIPPRIAPPLWRMNKRLFHAMAYLWSSVTNRRQILVVAQNPSD